MNLVKQNFYTFEVDKNATKHAIAKLVAKKFAVDVLEVRTVNLPKKLKAQRTRKGYFEVAGRKKAIVKIKSGQKIPLFEQAPQEDVTVTTAEGEKLTTVKEKKSLLKGTKVTIESSNKNQELSKKSDKKDKKGTKSK